MSKLITKNDIWRLIGIVLLVGGQLFHKESFVGFGISMETNLMQITGAILLLLPFVLRGMAAYKDKKQSTNSNDNPQI